MEQAAIEHDIECLAEGLQFQCIGHEESGGEPALLCLAQGDLDRERNDVDPRCRQAKLRRQQHVFPGPASDVEDPTGDRASICKRPKGGLWVPNVPGNDALIHCIGPVFSSLAVGRA